MELEYKDDRRKGRFVILAGVILALVAGGIAFYTVNQAQQRRTTRRPTRSASSSRSTRSPRASRSRPPTSSVREVPLDPTNANGVITDASLVGGADRRRDDPPGPAGHDQHAGVRHRGRGLLDPPARRELRPRLRGLAGDLDHRLGRPRGRRHAHGRRERRRVRHDRRRRPQRHDRQVHLRPVDEGDLPGRHDPRAQGRVLHHPRPRGRGRGDRPPPGDGRRDVQPCPAARSRTSARSMRPPSARRPPRSSRSTACRSRSPSCRGCVPRRRPRPHRARAPIRPRAATRPRATTRPTSERPPHPPPPPSPDGGAPAQPGTSDCRRTRTK